MTVGEKIKELRKKNDLTQEKLADFLCVSYQAVSKWECGLSSPDLSLIVPLARLFGVTTDELLGAANGEEDKRRSELEAMFNKTYKTGDSQLSLRICEDAVREYPGDMNWLNRLAWEVWCMDIDTMADGADFEAQREKAIKLFDTVIENTQDDEVKVNAIQGIVQCLCDKGAKDEARKYVELFPDTKVIPATKERLLMSCLSGDEQIRQKQHYVEGLLMTFTLTLLWDQVGEAEYTCAAAEAIINAIIPDGNYCEYHHHMAHIQFRKAEMAVKSGDGDRAVELLKKAAYHAREYDIIDTVSPGEYAFTAPLLNKLTIDSREFCRRGTGTLTDDIKEMCRRNSFDPIRERDDFKALF